MSTSLLVYVRPYIIAGASPLSITRFFFDTTGAKKKLGKKKRRPSPFEKGPGLPKLKSKNVG